MNYDNDDCSTAYSPSQNTLQTESGGGTSTNLNVKGVPGTGQDQDNSDAGSFWSVTSSEAIPLNAREPIHIAEDTKIKMGLGHDYDWEDQVYYPPETMIVVEHDIWTNKKTKEKRQFVDISGYTSTFSQSDLKSINLNSFMSSTHWAKKINQLNQALDDNLGDLRELGEGVDPEDSMVSIQVSLTDMLYALETEEDKHGDSQVQIRVLSKADADYLRDNMGYSRWRRRDKTIV